MSERNQKPKVVVIGAGISGLSCAVNLIDRCDVTILEARDRIGGRINTRRFEDKFYYEDGAQWVFTGKKDSLNSFAEKHNIEFIPFLTKKRFLYEDHEAKNGEYERLDDVLQSFDSKIIDATKNIHSSNNLLAYVNESWSHSKEEEFSPLKSSMLQFQGVKEGCGDLENVNIKDYLNFNSDRGVNTTFQIIRGGSDKILNKLIETLPKDVIKCNKKVLNVKWDGDNVRLRVKDSESGDSSFIDADYVVSTLPLGVLKNSHENMFEPCLPVEKADAIKKLGFGSVAKVNLRFKSGDITGCEGQTHLYLLRKNAFKYGNYSVLVFRSPGNNEEFMTIWLVGKEADLAEKTKEEVLIKEFGADLRKFLPSLPYPFAAHVTRFTQDEYAKGSFPYISSQSTVKDITNLAEPVYHTSANGDRRPRILFAGDSTSEDQYPLLNGAFESGIREAKRLLDII